MSRICYHDMVLVLVKILLKIQYKPIYGCSAAMVQQSGQLNCHNVCLVFTSIIIIIIIIKLTNQITGKKNPPKKKKKTAKKNLQKNYCKHAAQ